MIIIRRANEMESQPPYLDVQIQTKNALIEMPRTLKKKPCYDFIKINFKIPDDIEKNKSPSLVKWIFRNV